MAILVVQRNIIGNAAALANPTLAFTSNVTAGNAIIAVTTISSSSTFAGKPSDTLQNVFIPLPISTVANVNLAVHIAYNTPGGANTVTFSTGFQDSACMVFEVSGLAYTGAFDQYAFQQISSGTALTSGNTPTTRYPNQLLLGIHMNLNSTALLPTVGAGFSNLQTIGVTFCSSASEEQIVSAVGTTPATFTLAANATTEFTAIYTFSDTPLSTYRFNNSGLRPHPFSPGLAR